MEEFVQGLGDFGGIGFLEGVDVEFGIAREGEPLEFGDDGVDVVELRAGSAEEEDVGFFIDGNDDFAHHANNIGAYLVRGVVGGVRDRRCSFGELRW